PTLAARLNSPPPLRRATHNWLPGTSAPTGDPDAADMNTQTANNAVKSLRNIGRSLPSCPMTHYQVRTRFAVDGRDRKAGPLISPAGAIQVLVLRQGERVQR